MNREIPNGWKNIKLGDIAKFCYGKMPKKEMINTGNYPTFSGYKYQYTYPEYNCKKEDLIVVARGVGGTGDVKLVKELCFLTNLSIIITLINEVALNRYLFYKFSLNNLRYLDSGSAQSQITISDLQRIQIILPPISEQKAIADILSSLDEKIELLEEENKTLETLAQTIFTEWFVNFNYPCLPIGAGKPYLRENILQYMTYKRVGGVPSPQSGKSFVYVILCEDESKYIGLTDDIYKRWYEHNAGIGAKWTKANKPVKIIHWEEFDSREEAAKREKELKTGFGRTWLKREYEKYKKLVTGSPALECKLRIAGEMVDSELGEIPKGWRVGKLGEVVEFIVDNRGKTPSLIDSEEIKFPLVEVNALTYSSRNIKLENIKKFVGKLTYDTWFRKGHPKKGDILISTVGSIGELALINDEKICIAQNIIAIRGKYNGTYMYQLLLTIIDKIKSLDISSVQPSIKVPHMLNVDIAIPDNVLIDEYVSIVSSLVDKIAFNSEHIRKLVITRDTLLPKLTTGEIRVEGFGE